MALQPLVFISLSLSFSLAVLLSATPCYWFHLSFTVQLKVFTIFLLPTQHARSLSCRPPDIAFLCCSPKSIVLILAWIDCAISYCKRGRLHHAYIHLYPFHLSLPFPSSNSFRACWHASAETKSPTFPFSVPVPLKLELTNFWGYCCTWSCYWDTILHELVVYQELLEMSEKDIFMYSQAKKKFQTCFEKCF